MGVATVIHWDRFNHRHVAFWIWAALYFTTPFLVAGTWMANRRTEAPAQPSEVFLSQTARWVIGVLGAMAVALGLYLFLLPSRAIDIWSWALTPLTSRVMGAIFMLGLAGLGVFVDPRWSTARLMMHVQSLMMALILVAAVRAHRDFDSGRPMTWLLLGGFSVTLIATVVLMRTMDARSAE
jgi:hypothetical protein